jgi:hypothetical protein
MTNPVRAERFAKITVTIERRLDGGLRAYSADVPGFVLSHPDAELLLADVRPAIETILSAMWGMQIIAKPLTSVSRFADDDDSDTELPAAHICKKEYVAYYAA